MSPARRGLRSSENLFCQPSLSCCDVTNHLQNVPSGEIDTIKLYRLAAQGWALEGTMLLLLAPLNSHTRWWLTSFRPVFISPKQSKIDPQLL